MTDGSTGELEKALHALDIALKAPKNALNRDASIQRFEFCIELSWKTAKRLMGSNSTAPKVVIREMPSQGLIDDPDSWFHYLEARNLSSHTYKEAIAEQVYEAASEFLPDGQELLKRLKAM